MTGEKPSRESLREVKREYRERRKAERRPEKPPKPPKPPRERWGAGRIAALVVVGLLVVAVGGAVAIFGGAPPPPSRRASDRVPVLVPTETPSPVRSTLPADDPFRGSKVDHWPVGAAGLAAPKAVAAGTFREAQVGEAYAKTLAHLRAAMLDRRVIHGGDLAPARATLDPRVLRHLTPIDLANRFRRDVVAASPEIRVNGTLTARAVSARRLEVGFRYVAVYALRPATGGDVELVAIRRTGTLHFDREGRGVSAPWVREVQHTSSHSRCGWAWPDGRAYLEVWLGPAEPRGATPTATPSGAREKVNLLDPRGADPKGCFDNTGEL